MQTIRMRYQALIPGLAAANQAHAAPIEGEAASNAAALLVLLGIWALLMGMRNLRRLRYQRMYPDRSARRGGD